MHVTELSEDELLELKGTLYLGTDIEYKTEEQQVEIDNADIPSDISDELVFALFDHYDFVEDDFLCNVPNRD